MKMKSITNIFTQCTIACGMTIALFACSHIDEDEQMVVVDRFTEAVDEPVEYDPDSLYDAPVQEVKRTLLIEDHTGQKCPNCPDATKIIHELMRSYGSRLVPVAIHSQQQGIMEPQGLGTELGNTYFKNWKIEFKPAGLISRMDGGDGVVFDKTIWTMAVQSILEDVSPAPLDIRVKARQEEAELDKADIHVKVIATSETQVSGKLQVWVTEDAIVAEQDSMGVHITDYVHNHVLRSAVNGTWGEDVSVGGFADNKEFEYNISLSSAWKPENLVIVAFVYNDEGVVQATKRALTLSANE